MAGALSLPVVWSEDGGPSLPGRLDLTADSLRLSGGSRDEPRTHEIALAEVAAVRIARGAHERLTDRAALVVELRSGNRISIACIDRPGTLHELAERLQRAARLSR
jgi:hypothetical protein